MKRMWILVGGLWALLGAGSLAAQDGGGNVADRPLATRDELQAALERAGASEIAARIRTRLSEGDFRSGDRILLTVQGEPTLTDTFTIGRGANLILPEPTTGSLSLQGVLRSELETKLTQYIARFRNNPVVQAQPLIRLSVQGEVAKAGVYAVPADGQLADALMAAGGTTQYAKVDHITIERNGDKIWQGSAFQTDLDAIGLHDGDQIVVDSNRPHDASTLRVAALIVSMAVGLYGLSRAIH